MNPKKKKLEVVASTSKLKRTSQAVLEPCKRLKSDEIKEDSYEKDVKAMKRKNFIKACEQVSCKAYFDQRIRLQLVYLPTCSNERPCRHHDYKKGLTLLKMPSYAEESFKIEMKTNMWCEALEVCQLCITHDQFLSANVLKDVVEIIMNAHHDPSADYTVTYLIDKCQQILSQNFSAHPPCIVKNLRKCYIDFLFSPMELRENTFTNRQHFECDKGIAKYCMNRLEHEISSKSKDEALINKDENIPDEMKQSVKGLHWQKEKFEIFELLERPERISRLMAVLETVLELLQFDLAIWNSRYTNNLGCHVMRSHKPFMAYILWSDNALYTGAVNNNCKQILRIFVYFVHLQYPEEYVRIMTAWLNTMIQIFYICEKNSNCDYPNSIGKYCTSFAREFYKIISEMPPKSIIRILEKIQPHYMQNLVGVLHIKTLLPTEENDIIQILMDFVKKSQWQLFPAGQGEIHVSKNTVIKPRKIQNIASYLSRKCKTWASTYSPKQNCDDVYPKFNPELIMNGNIIDQNCVVHILYITLEAYLDAYNVQDIQDSLDMLNEQSLLGKCDTQHKKIVPCYGSYFVTEQFIKKYRSMYQMLKELMLILFEVKNSDRLPENMNIFKNIGILSS